MRFKAAIHTMCLSAILGVATPATAIEITINTSAAALAAALTAGSTGIVVTGMMLNGHSTSTGTYTNISGTYSIGPGVVLSSGNVSHYNDGPNTVPNQTTAYGVPATAAQEMLLDQITGGAFNHFDVTELVIMFDMMPGFDMVFFNVVFGSEEFPEFVGSNFIDGFGLFLNGMNIARVGGLPVNINHPGMMALGGTQLDGILAPGGFPVLLFSGAVNPTGNVLRFILADTSDPILDTTTYISALGGTPPGVIPEPTTAVLLLTGLAGVAARQLRKRPRTK